MDIIPTVRRTKGSFNQLLCNSTFDFAMIKESVSLVGRTVDYPIPSRVDACTRRTFVRRVIAEGAVEPPDLVVIADYCKSGSCWFYASARDRYYILHADIAHRIASVSERKS